jgi:serine/threonine protein kinase
MNYELVKELGKGASGRVYLAKRDDSLGNPKLVVMKVIDNQQRGTHEIAILKRIPEHKNLAKMLDSFMNGKKIVIVYEYIDNAITLHKYRPNTALQILDVFYQLCDGLSVLHQNGIIHIDLKPQNVMMKGDIPIIIDYDMSCLNLEEVQERLKCKNMRGIRGTPNYIPPEIWKKEGTFNSATDIYSLGVIFYFVASGKKLPYRDAKSMEETKEKVIHTSPIPLYTGNEELNALVMKMISKDKDSRPTLDTIKDTLSKLIKAN